MAGYQNLMVGWENLMAGSGRERLLMAGWEGWEKLMARYDGEGQLQQA
jgi:hypothetical protein